MHLYAQRYDNSEIVKRVLCDNKSIRTRAHRTRDIFRDIVSRLPIAIGILAIKIPSRLPEAQYVNYLIFLIKKIFFKRN